MLTARVHLECALSSGNGSSKKGVAPFYRFIESELLKHGGNASILRYANPLKMTLCIYFVLLSNHRFYKSYNSRSLHSPSSSNSSRALNDNGDSMMSDAANISLSANDRLPATGGFQKASHFETVTPNLDVSVSVDPPFPMEMVYALPVCGCIGYLRSMAQAQGDRVDGVDGVAAKERRESIEKSIEKYVYLMRHHYPHLLYWLPLDALLVSPKFEFLEYGLNLDLMADALHFDKSMNGAMLQIHESIIADFVRHRGQWLDAVSFVVPEAVLAMIGDDDVSSIHNVHALPSEGDLDAMLKAMASSFEHNDFVHSKWQHVLCWWWHRFAMEQPLSFVVSSLRYFMADPAAFDDIRYVGGWCFCVLVQN